MASDDDMTDGDWLHEANFETDDEEDPNLCRGCNALMEAREKKKTCALCKYEMHKKCVSYRYNDQPVCEQCYETLDFVEPSSEESSEALDLDEGADIVDAISSKTPAKKPKRNRLRKN